VSVLLAVLQAVAAVLAGAGVVTWALGERRARRGRAHQLYWSSLEAQLEEGPGVVLREILRGALLAQEGERASWRGALLAGASGLAALLLSLLQPWS
jgi:hypothetical protein